MAGTVWDALEHATSNTGGAALAPGAAVPSPTGGSTVDAEARAAIDLIITRLEGFGLVVPN